MYIARNELVIPRAYHFFYQGLHVENSAVFNGDTGQYDPSKPFS